MINQLMLKDNFDALREQGIRPYSCNGCDNYISQSSGLCDDCQKEFLDIQEKIAKKAIGVSI